jgi:hypothetical protein
MVSHIPDLNRNCGNRQVCRTKKACIALVKYAECGGS